MAELKERYKQFANNYLACGNARQAARDAGYSKEYAKVRAHKILAIVSQSEYYKKRKAEADAAAEAEAKKKLMTAVELREILARIIRGEDTEKVVKKDSWGKRLVDMPVPTKDRLKAAELYARMDGLFADRLNITGALPVVICGEDNLED